MGGGLTPPPIPPPRGGTSPPYPPSANKLLTRTISFPSVYYSITILACTQKEKMDRSLDCARDLSKAGGRRPPRWPPAKEWSLYTKITKRRDKSVQGGTSQCTGGYVTMYRGVRHLYRGVRHSQSEFSTPWAGRSKSLNE
jgi:hypothetical protein